MKKLEKEKALCLAIDVQERLVPAMFKTATLVEEVKNILQGMKALNVPVLFTEQYPKGLGHTLEEVREICPEAAVIEKTQFSAWIPELQTKLKSLDRKQIILFGTETHVCVLQTALDLLEAGYEVYVPYECVGSRTLENINSGLNIMDREGAQVTNRETVLFQLLKDAKTPEFKEISILVK